MKHLIILISMIISVVLTCACTAEPPSSQNDTAPSEPAPPVIDPAFCGTSTNAPCATDSDCITGGCSGQVCQSKNEEPVMTTCEYLECYNKEKYSVACRCTQDKCQWTSTQAQ